MGIFRDLATAKMISCEPVSVEITKALMNFVHRNNIGKIVEVQGETYRLLRIHEDRDNGLHIYFSVGRSILRISDKWSSTRHFPKSKKLNCGDVEGAFWALRTRNRDAVESKYLVSTYPRRLLAGRAGKCAVNRHVDFLK